MTTKSTRRTFIKSAALAGIGLSVGSTALFAHNTGAIAGKRVGIIGLDTSHSIAFTKSFNAENPDPKLGGYRVVAAYPHGSKTIESSASRIPGYIDDIKALGVTIVDSIDALLAQVDVVLLETNDGRLHLDQVLPVFKAGKRVFIDKPIAASLEDTKAIFRASKEYNIPTFSTSSLRYIENAAALKSGNMIGSITGVDTFSPAVLEPTHPDLFWYGIHGVEMLYAILGAGCQYVKRVYTEGTDIVVGTWADGRIGVFRGIRQGRNGFGGMAFGAEGQSSLGKYTGYMPMLYEIVRYFETGISPIDPDETTELVAFMEAADESKRLGGESVDVQAWLNR